MTNVAEKHRLLKGIIKWDIASQYGPRTWAFNKGLKQLDAALQENKSLSQLLVHAEKSAPQRFEGYGDRIDQSRARIERLLALTDEAQLAQQQLLESMAIGQLRQQQQRLESYLTHAQFSVAQIQDSAAHDEEEKTP